MSHGKLVAARTITILDGSSFSKAPPTPVQGEGCQCPVMAISALPSASLSKCQPRLLVEPRWAASHTCDLDGVENQTPTQNRTKELKNLTPKEGSSSLYGENSACCFGKFRRECFHYKLPLFFLLSFGFNFIGFLRKWERLTHCTVFYDQNNQEFVCTDCFFTIKITGLKTLSRHGSARF